MSSLSSSATLLSAKRGPAFLPFLLLLFLGSGCAALIYEIVWFQLLEFAVGVSAASIAVLLGTFMGGLCLGSLLYARLFPTRWHPLRVYACLELGIGILGVLITMGLPTIDRLYASIAHGAASGIGFRALIAVLCLLPPTLLMGATLPAISRWVETTPQGVSWLGFFYGGNTVGAVIGCLLAGFYLLPNFRMVDASYVAAVINLAVALLAFLISLGASYTPPLVENKATLKATPMEEFNNVTIYVAIGLSGMAALGAEVIWTRLLSLLLGATVYTFSIILAVFLVGLALGSSLGAMLARNVDKPRNALAWCQILCILGIGWSAYAVTNGLPFWPVDTFWSFNPTSRFQLDLARCAWAILPPTLFWGASFPLALAALVSESPTGRDPARIVGRVYAANTVGAIVGAMFFSLIAIRAWGSQNAQHLLILLSGLAAYVVVLPSFLPRPGSSTRDMISNLVSQALKQLCAFAVPVAVISLLSFYNLSLVPWKLVAWGRDTPRRAREHYAMVDWGEGVNSSVAVTSYIDGNGESLCFHVAGKVEASTNAQDMRLQLMLGHYPSLFHPDPKKPKSVLVVGCGAGVTAGAFILYPHEKIVICELEPLVTKMALHFSQQNNNVVTQKRDGSYVDPAVNVIYDDARHYVLTTDQKFDIITSDPIHPWVKGAASLYTREYFESVKAHLNPGGVVTQWVPLYESTLEVVKSEIATFFAVFPNSTIWINSDANGGGYDVILMGSNDPLTIDGEALKTRLGSPLISGMLKKSQLSAPLDILRTYGGRAVDLKEWTATGQINHDSNLRLQYMAGRANTQNLATDIQRDFLGYRRFPADMMKVSDEDKKQLEDIWFGRVSAP